MIHMKPNEALGTNEGPSDETIRDCASRLGVSYWKLDFQIQTGALK